MHKNRRTEVFITRFRLGKIINNHYLKNFQLHPTGLCAVCDVPDDIQHTLFGCRTKLVKELREFCTKHGVPRNTGAVFNNIIAVSIIARFYKTIV